MSVQTRLDDSAFKPNSDLENTYNTEIIINKHPLKYFDPVDDDPMYICKRCGMWHYYDNTTSFQHDRCSPTSNERVHFTVRVDKKLRIHKPSGFEDEIVG